MLGTYGALALILAAAGSTGQALLAVCGERQWSWLAPAVGLALVTALSWGTVRLPSHGTAAAVAVGVAALAAVAYLRGRVTWARVDAWVAVAVTVGAVLLASLPFIFEGRFGILGTGLNPDMSQHLFAADRLADGGTERLAASGYPLGPHSIVVAVSALGPGLVQGFGGLTLATAVIAALVPLAALQELARWRQAAGALLVGFAYMVSSYLIQGAFKETMEALFVLAFAVGLHGLARASRTSRLRGPPISALAAVPLAALAVGSVYAYSFPGLLWLGGGTVLWALAELIAATREGPPGAVGALARASARPAAVALGVLAIAIAPEVGRMIDFASFETFDPSGSGLGNLFNPISPFEALGIWPSGDFRLDAGAGAVPAIGFYLGCLLAAVALAIGLWWWLRRREPAVPAVLTAAGLLIAYAGFAGTPYQEAKAIAIAAAPAMLVSATALLAIAVTSGQAERIVRRRALAPFFPRSARLARLRLVFAALAVAFLAGAAGCSLLALANGPVGPTTYTPALTELRPLMGSTLVLAPQPLLDEHGRDYLVWELRGGRVCVDAAAGPGVRPPPRGISQVVTVGPEAPPFAGVRRERRSGEYTVWKVVPAPAGPGHCPLISPGARAEVAPSGIG
jgi:hypothetical protein